MLTVERYSRQGWQPGLIADSAALMSREYAARFGVGAAYEAWVTTELASFFTGFDDRLSDWWGVRVKDVLAGCCAVDGRRGGGREAEFRWFCLAPPCRGRGVGRQLLDEAVAWARQRGLQRLHLQTHPSLVAAVHLYERAGFRACGEVPGPSFAPHLAFEGHELTLGRDRQTAAPEAAADRRGVRTPARALEAAP